MAPQDTLGKALAALVPACLLFSGSAMWFRKGRDAPSLLQLLGASGVVLVVLTHVAEALHIFPWMHWGAEGSLGHYLDLGGAVLGLGAFPLGYWLQALRFKREAEKLTAERSG